MPPLQNLLSRTQIITKEINTPLIVQLYNFNNINKRNLELINKVNARNKQYLDKVNKTVLEIHLSAIRDPSLADSLNTASLSIAPLTRNVTELKISILKSIGSKSVPIEYIKDISKPIQPAKGKNAEKKLFTQKTTIIPLTLKRPISTLYETAGAIKNRSLDKPKTNTDMIMDHKVVRKDELASVSDERTSIIEQDSLTTRTESDERTSIIEQDSSTTRTEHELNLESEPGRRYELNKKPILERKTKTESDITTVEPFLTKGAPKEETIKSIHLKKSIPLKNLSFLQPDLTPEKPTSEIKEGQLEPILNSTGDDRELHEPIKPDELTRASTREPRQSLIEKPTTPIIPIVSALGLLAGSTTVAGTTVYRPQTMPKIRQKKVAGRSDDELGSQAYRKITTTEDRSRALELVKPKKDDGFDIRGPEILKPVESMEPTSAPELDKPLGASAEQPRGMQIEPRFIGEPNEVKATGLEIPRAGYDELALIDLPKKGKTTWVSIAAAVGLISGLSTTATALNMQEKKMQIIPKTDEMVELSIPRQKTDSSQPKYELKSMDKSKTTIAKPVDLTRPKGDGFRETGSTIKGKLALPIVSATSVAGALGALSLIAKNTELPNEVAFKIIPPAKSGLEVDDTPLTIQKHMANVNANLPVSTRYAIDNMNRLASRSRDSLYVDIVKPKKRLSKVREITKSESKEVEQKKVNERIEDDEQTGITEVQRSIMIDKSAAGALDILTKTAANATTTAAQIQAVSKSRLPEIETHEEIPIDTPVGIRLIPSKVKPKTQVLVKGFRLESETKPDLILPKTDKTIDLDFESETNLETNTVGDVAEALNILNLIALSSGRTEVEKQLVIQKSDLRAVDVKAFKTTRRSKEEFSGKKSGLTTPNKPEDKLTFKTRNLSRKTAHIYEPGVKRLPGISEAIGLIRPPERRLAMALNRPIGRNINGANITGTNITRANITGAKHDGRGVGVRATETKTSERAISTELSRAGKGLDKQIKTEIPFLQKGTDDMGKALIDMALSKPAAAADFGKDRMLELEQQVRILKDRIRSEVDDQQPYHRKLQEVIHDPNLQTQLKKLFYEAWLENLDKELKRYGE